MREGILTLKFFPHALVFADKINIPKQYKKLLKENMIKAYKNQQNVSENQSVYTPKS